MTKRDIRKAIFSDMLMRGKHWSTTRLAWKLAWLMEQKGYTQLEARQWLKLGKASAIIHTLNLYYLRRGFIEKELHEKERTNKSA